MVITVVKIRAFSLISLVILICFWLAFLLPSGGPNETVKTILTVTGILFGVIIGFFIAYLWNRLEKMREFVNIEVSNLQTYYLLAENLARYSKNQKWVQKQKKLIEQYIIQFTMVEWTDYDKIDPYFNRIIKSLKEIPPLKTKTEEHLYHNLVRLLTEISTARENLFNFGKVRLTKQHWMVMVFLAIVLEFSIFFLKTPEFFSILCTAVLASIVIILLLILWDLNDLRLGEEIISFEPYQRVLDVIGKPRFYLKKDIKSGRVKLPKDKEYRIGE